MDRIWYPQYPSFSINGNLCLPCTWRSPYRYQLPMSSEGSALPMVNHPSRVHGDDDPSPTTSELSYRVKPKGSVIILSELGNLLSWSLYKLKGGRCSLGDVSPNASHVPLRIPYLLLGGDSNLQGLSSPDPCSFIVFFQLKEPHCICTPLHCVTSPLCNFLYLELPSLVSFQPYAQCGQLNDGRR